MKFLQIKVIPILCGLLLFAATGSILYTAPLAGNTVTFRRGDANSDGTLNIFDVLSLLRQMGEKDSVADGTDYDLNGKIDIYDLLGVVRELASLREKSEANLQFFAEVSRHLLTEPVVNPRQRWDALGEVRSSYRIYSDRPLLNAEMIFNADTIRGFEGTTPLIFKVDPDTMPEFINGTIYSDPFSWIVRVEDLSGMWHGDSGTSKFRIMEPNVIEDYGARIVGAEINFPLVLKGAWQRFRIIAGEFGETDTIAIDLNRACLDSVVFPGIDSLASTIMEQILEYESLRPEKPNAFEYFLLVAPATNYHTQQSCSKLILDPNSLGALIAILPEDDNTNLLKRLGFPGWIRQLPYHIADYNYEIALSWYERYQLRRSGR